MLLKLVPPFPDPTVLFTLDFPTLPANVQLPQAWLNQITILNIDELDLPSSFHALDKSIAITVLLQEVVFDIRTLTVSCTFIDGVKEEWPLMGPACLKALESVLQDVNTSSLLQEDRDAEREAEQHRWRESEREKLLAHSQKPTKHKKQRSLLMSLVASLVPSVRSPSPPSQASPPTPPPPSYHPPPPPQLSARALRLRASSTLVDTYRLHILSELTRRVPPGGYYTWIAKSMLRQVSANMDALIQEAGDTIPNVVHGAASNSTIRHRRAEFYSLPVSFTSWPYDEEGDGSDDTDTDGSSVHTPASSSSFHNLILLPSNSSSPTSICPPSSIPSQFDPENTRSAESLARYASLSSLAGRLRQLLMLASANQVHEMREIQHREAMLEIRCKRRAWLNKRLVAGAGVGGMRDGGIGMAMPFERSPLGLRSWLAEDVEEVEEEEVEDADGEDTWNGNTEAEEDEWMSPLRKKFKGMRLLTVEEEREDYGDGDGADDDEGELVTRELELDLELNLEEGWIRSDENVTAAAPMDIVLERPSVLPRMRPTLRMGGINNSNINSSMYLRRHCLDSFELPVSFPNSRPHHLTPGSLLCQPLKGCIGGGGAGGAAPVGDGGNVSAFDTEGGGGGAYGPVGCEDEEFTLAMDLPFKRRGGGGEVVVIDGDGGGGGQGYGENEGRWIAPASLGVVDCR